MQKKMVLTGLGVTLALLSLLVFTACPTDGGDDGSDTGVAVNIGQVEITNIPKTVGDKDSYKIFVQLSEGMDADAGYVAKGAIVIDDTTPQFLYDHDDEVWNGEGKYNVAVVVSPKEVSSWKDILVYGAQNKLFSSDSSKKQSFNVDSLVKLHKAMPSQVKQLFNGEGVDDPGIICVPESGIIYPPSLGK